MAKNLADSVRSRRQYTPSNMIGQRGAGVVTRKQKNAAKEISVDKQNMSPKPTQRGRSRDRSYNTTRRLSKGRTYHAKTIEGTGPQNQPNSLYDMGTILGEVQEVNDHGCMAFTYRFIAPYVIEARVDNKSFPLFDEIVHTLFDKKCNINHRLPRNKVLITCFDRKTYVCFLNVLRHYGLIWPGSMTHKISDLPIILSSCYLDKDKNWKFVDLDLKPVFKLHEDYSAVDLKFEINHFEQTYGYTTDQITSEKVAWLPTNNLQCYRELAVSWGLEENDLIGPNWDTYLTDADSPRDVIDQEVIEVEPDLDTDPTNLDDAMVLVHALRAQLKKVHEKRARRVTISDSPPIVNIISPLKPRIPPKPRHAQSNSKRTILRSNSYPMGSAVNTDDQLLRLRQDVKIKHELAEDDIPINELVSTQVNNKTPLFKYTKTWPKTSDFSDAKKFIWSVNCRSESVFIKASTNDALFWDQASDTNPF